MAEMNVTQDAMTQEEKLQRLQNLENSESLERLETTPICSRTTDLAQAIDFNVLLAGMSQSDWSLLSPVVMRQVLNYDFGDDFACLKAASAYFLACKPEDFMSEMLSDADTTLFLQHFNLFEHSAQARGYEHAIAHVYSLIPQSPPQGQLHDLMRRRLYGRAFDGVLAQCLNDPGLSDALSAQAVSDYESFFSSVHHDVRLCLASLSPTHVRAIAVLRHYLGFFMAYPREFEAFRLMHDLPSVCALAHELVCPGVFLLQLTQTHLHVLHAQGKEMTRFMSRVLEGLCTYSPQACRYIVQEMLHEPGWQAFMGSQHLGYGSLMGYLQRLDQTHATSCMSALPSERLKKKFETLLSDVNQVKEQSSKI